jgi:hypothetical protein
MMDQPKGLVGAAESLGGSTARARAERRAEAKKAGHMTRQRARRIIFEKALKTVRDRDLKPVPRIPPHVGWEGDTRSERRKQAKALAKKWWLARPNRSANAEKPLAASTAEGSAKNQA